QRPHGPRTRSREDATFQDPDPAGGSGSCRGLAIRPRPRADRLSAPL
ncbi:MAG: Translation initiation factor 1, partial [uncultured Solirubrobacteraceae bacterium]